VPQSLGRVLVVEDEPDILTLVVKHLRSNGFIADDFTDPVTALAHFKNNSMNYSVVLTDIRMPDMNGFELAHEIQKIRPDIKIVLMTAFEITHEDLQTILPIIKYDEIIRKPFKLVEICTTVRKQINAD